MQRVHIDLLSLPTSAGPGYSYLCLIVCALSKFPIGFPLVNKDMDSVAECLWSTISTFGAPEECVSDNGSEFVNKVFDALANIHGINRRLTSRYRPQSNGQVERFNRTVVATLLKLCGNTPQLWPEWLDFVLLSIRTAVHRSTQFTPFQLMFGRDWNPLRDFHQVVVQWELQGESSGPEPLDEGGARDEAFAHAFSSRARLLRQQIEWSRASSNLQQASVQQAATQDKSHHTSLERLPSGSEVWLRVEPRDHKLMHHFKGPFRVVSGAGVEVNSNYILEEIASGAVLARSVPRDKIFLSVNIPLTRRQAELFCPADIEAISSRLDNPEPGPVPPGFAQGGRNGAGSFAIRRILDSRAGKGLKERFYLVSWEGYEQPTWEPESNLEPGILAELLRKFPFRSSA